MFTQAVIPHHTWNSRKSRLTSVTFSSTLKMSTVSKFGFIPIRTIRNNLEAGIKDGGNINNKGKVTCSWKHWERWRKQRHDKLGFDWHSVARLVRRELSPEFPGLQATGQHEGAKTTWFCTLRTDTGKFSSTEKVSCLRTCHEFLCVSVITKEPQKWGLITPSH